jgi:hypothetical protein
MDKTMPMTTKTFDPDGTPRPSNSDVAANDIDTISEINFQGAETVPLAKVPASATDSKPRTSGTVPGIYPNENL